MKKCSICNINDGKYKCPICLVYYCSVACCNKHRLDKCEVATKAEPTSHSTIKTTDEILYPTGSTVAIAKLKLLKKSKELNDILSNHHLRTLLTHVNNATNAEGVMAKVMLEPIFVEFANACLDLIEDEQKTIDIDDVD